MKLPRNLVRGGCNELDARLRTTGPVDEAGTIHKNWAGYTYPRIHPGTPAGAYRTTQTPAGYETCLTVTRMTPTFSAPVTQDVVRWAPEKPVPPACSAEYLNWHRQAVDHEMQHVQRMKPILDQFNASWDRSVTFSTRVCQTGATARDSQVSVDKEALAQASAFFHEAMQKLLGKIQLDSDEFHQSNTVPYIDCSQCP
jgi:hypothetical protein